MKRNPYLVNKAFNNYLLATILSSIALTIGVVVDGIIVGNFLGADALSAVNLASPLLQLFSTIFLLLNVGGSIIFAMSIGKRELKDANNIFTHSMLMNLGVGLLISIVGIFFSNEIASFFCPNASLFPKVHEYLKIALYSSPIYLFLPGIAVYVSTDNNPRLASVALISANVINLLLDLLFIKGLDMGIRGSSLATSVGYGVGILIVLTHFFRGKGILKYAFTKNKGMFKKIIIMGLPLALSSICIMIQLLSVNHIILDKLGASGISVLAVCMNVLMISSMFIAGTVDAMQPIASVLYGAEDYKGVKLVILSAVKFLLITLVGFTIIIEIFPSVFALLFGLNDPQLLGDFNVAFRWFALSIPFFGFNYLMLVVYQLSNRNILATLIPIMETVLLVAVMFFLSFVELLWIVWTSYIISAIVVVGLIFIYSAVIRSKRKELAPLVLINQTIKERVVLDFSVDNKVDSINRANKKIVEFLDSQVLLKPIQNKICLCFEELIHNIFKYAFVGNKRHFIDVNLSILPNKIILTIKDDGLAFNPFSYDKKTGLGLMIVNGSCKDVNYSRIMNQNVATLIFQYDSNNTTSKNTNNKK